MRSLDVTLLVFGLSCIVCLRCCNSGYLESEDEPETFTSQGRKANPTLKEYLSLTVLLYLYGAKRSRIPHQIKSFLIFASILLPTQLVTADTITLANGDKYTGEVNDDNLPHGFECGL
eukprot:TRINITY_DN13702_c0_g1_i5.p1 TRINITY_DN13702_c0_g1~~TRINITY_DN13702_c0_g1_i5.p1  ORF type:complete len:118 (+),score=4.39 TRINITY_DN13702_c0_g1_i5:32-385(+)